MPPDYLTAPAADPVAFLSALLMERSYQPVDSGIGEHVTPWTATKCAEVAAAIYMAWAGTLGGTAQEDLKALWLRLRWAAEDDSAPMRLYLEVTDERPLEGGLTSIRLPPGGRSAIFDQAALVANVKELRARVHHWYSLHGEECRAHQMSLARLRQIALLAEAN